MTLAPRASIFTIFPQALFLACSWTWCIGMWFPVYMVKDWGWPGWAAFLAPNAIGAALVGFIHTASSSPRFVAANLPAMRAFSVVTILFHVSWLTWLLPCLISRSVVGQGWVGGAIAVLALLVAARMSAKKNWTARAIIVYLLSVAAAVASWRLSSTLRVPPETGEQTLNSLHFALPMLILGFGLCPHLDLTFHRVRQETQGASGAAAFALAFGLFFPLLMLFTLLYAGGIRDRTWTIYLLIHLVPQAVFTIAAHLRELRPDGLGEWGVAWPKRRTQLVAGMVLMFTSAALPWMPQYKPSVLATRLAYELFMSFYALLFPAYIWIVAIDRGQSRPASIRAWIIASILAAPCMWVGYIERRYIWLLPAVGIVLVTPVVVKALLSRARSR